MDGTIVGEPSLRLGVKERLKRGMDFEIDEHLYRLKREETEEVFRMTAR